MKTSVELAIVELEHHQRDPNYPGVVTALALLKNAPQVGSVEAAADLLAACRLALPHHQGGHSAVGAALRAAIAKAEAQRNAPQEERAATVDPDFAELRRVVAVLLPALRYHTSGDCRRFHPEILHDGRGCGPVLHRHVEELQDALDLTDPGRKSQSDNRANRKPEGGR